MRTKKQTALKRRADSKNDEFTTAVINDALKGKLTDRDYDNLHEWVESDRTPTIVEYVINKISSKF